MFTGLVEGLGTIAALQPEGDGLRLQITPPAELASPPPAAGASIAINGCCLTVLPGSKGGWSFQAGAETLSKTNLGRLAVGDVVNLEQALPVSARLGGHLVQGHIDGTGVVDAIDRHGEWVDMWFRVPQELTALMVPKGSVAVDGVSLTLVNVEAERFSVALIPHTLEVTTLGRRAVGAMVNIEADILGKYVQKFAAAYREQVVDASAGNPQTPPRA